MRAQRIVFPVFAMLLTVAAAVAQEPTYMDAATHPGGGQFYTRLLVSQAEYEDSGMKTEERTAIFKLVYGIRPTLAVLAEAELSSLSADDSDETGLLWTTFQAKYRLFKKDLGPLNTWMASAFAGFTVPGEMDRTTGMDPYPRGAVVSTAILGRHGVNAGLKWEGYDNEPDRFGVNASHLYRIAPVEYGANTRGAWYTMLESLNEFTDDGDSRLDLAAGILYEAQRWAWELSFRLPLEQDWPQENNWNVTMGLRFLP
jgi:hypothetical protein